MRRVPLIALGCFVALAVVVAAAPRPKDRPADPAPDHLTGEMGTRMDSPVLFIPDPDGGQAVVWLVFRQEFSQEAALAGIEPGRKVTVRGKCGRGGAFRYLIAAEVTPAD